MESHHEQQHLRLLCSNAYLFIYIHVVQFPLSQEVFLEKGEKRVISNTAVVRTAAGPTEQIAKYTHSSVSGSWRFRSRKIIATETPGNNQSV